MSDPYWSTVVFLSGFEGGSIVDESSLAQTVTVVGGAAQSAAQFKYGTKALNRPNTAGNLISVPDNAALIAGGGLFTAEGWVYLSSASSRADQFLMGQWSDSGSTFGWFLKYDDSANQLAFGWSDAGGYNQLTGTANMSATTWYHFGADFDGNIVRLYFNGNCIGTDDWTGFGFNIDNATCALAIGAIADSASGCDFDGYLDEVRICNGVARYASSTTYTIPTAAFERGAGATSIYPVATTDAIRLTRATATQLKYGPVLSELFGLSRFASVSNLYTATSSDAINLSEALAALRGVVMAETIALSESVSPKLTYQALASDAVAILQQLLTGVPATIAEAIGIAPAQQAALALIVAEQLNLTSVLSPKATYGLSLAERVQILDSLAQFIGASISEALNLSEVITSLGSYPGVVSEALNLSETISPQFLLRAIVNESLVLDDDQILKALYNGTLTDAIELTAAYLSPGQGITTWAMNTRTAAVTEYQNYSFNSFAQVGDVALGANNTGLYELIGDTDAGTAIIADFKSGLAQLGGSHFTMFKGAYLAVRGTGDFVLKLTTGDGRSYAYGVTARNMRSAKINLGKGLRARYFAFELIGDGSDFDFESLEFIPLVPDRRV